MLKKKYKKVDLPVVDTQQDMPYFSSFIAKSWLNDLEDTGQGHYVWHLLMVVIICA